MIFRLPSGCHSPMSPAHNDPDETNPADPARRAKRRGEHGSWTRVRAGRDACVEPAVDQNLFSEVVSLVVAREQGIPPHADLPPWNLGEGVVVHLRDRHKADVHIRHRRAHRPQHGQLVRQRNEGARAGFSQTWLASKHCTLSKREATPGDAMRKSKEKETLWERRPLNGWWGNFGQCEVEKPLASASNMLEPCNYTRKIWLLKVLPLHVYI